MNNTRNECTGIYLCNEIIYEMPQRSQQPTAGRRSAPKMSMPRIQRTLRTTRAPGMLTVMTWTAECFNNKIKMTLLILIWTLIWRTGECVVGGSARIEHKSNQAEHEADNIGGNLHEQMEIEIIGDNELVNPLVPAQLDAGVEPLTAGEEWTDVYDGRHSLEGDQFNTINETLNSLVMAQTSGDRRLGQMRDARKIFKRQLRRVEEQQAEEMAAVAEGTMMDPGEATNMLGINVQQTYGMQAATAIRITTIAEMNCANTMAAAMNTDDGKITESQNVRNNGNEHDKRPKVVDSGCATEPATTQQPTATSTTSSYGKTPATAAALAGAATYGQEQKRAENSEPTAANAEVPCWPHSDATEAEEPESPVDVTAALQQQLIYEFAIKYKHIPRVTFFTCRRLSGAQMQGKNAEAGNTFGQQMTYFNMHTVKIIERMYGTKVADKIRSAAGGDTVTESTAKKAAVKVNGAIKPAAAAAAPVPTAAMAMPIASKAGGANAKKVRDDINANSTRTAASTTQTKPTHTAAGNTPPSGKGNASREAHVAGDNDDDAAAATAATTPLGILIKVVHIDQLINKRPTAAINKNNNNRYSNNWYAQRMIGAGFGGGRGGGYGRSAGSAGSRNAYTNENWLVQVLRGDGSRQIVVLNLACGSASRRLLEMASNKALFNSTYHWLLIEDYTFNRQTGIDDNGKSERQNNKQVGNYSNNSNNGSSYSDNDNLAGKFFQQKQSQQLAQSKASDVATVATTADGVLPPATAAAFSPPLDEDDMEIIEKYLEKINININTELILAKRHTRRIRDDSAANADRRVVSLGRDCCTSNSESATNNTLQRKDYYQLYDVWSPGLQYGGQSNISEIGYFALDDGLQIALWYRRSTTITRRMDMKMARIRCLIVVTNKNHSGTLEHYLTTHYDTHLDSMHRFNFALLSHVRALFNFSFVLSKTASWGYLKNGKFDGMIGALVRKQADIGGSPIFFRIERAKVIDYTTRTWVARPCFIFRHPPSTKNDRIVFLQPFSNTVWILLGFCGIFTICLLWLLTTVERCMATFSGAKQFGQSARGNRNDDAAAAAKQQSAIGGNDELPGHGCSTWTTSSGSAMQCAASAMLLVGSTKEQRKQKLGKLMKLRKRVERKDVKRISCRPCMLGCGGACCGQTGTDVPQQRQGLFFEAVLFYVASICQQGLTFSTSFFSGRCIVITSLLFAFAIYQFYSASIVGTLLMEKPKTIRTLRDLIHSSLEVGVEDIAYNRDYFLHTKDPVAIELYAMKVTSVPTIGETLSEPTGDNATATHISALQPTIELTEAQKSKTYRDILHNHERGAHAKTNEASNWYDPDYGVDKLRKGKFAFHVDVATAYKIIADTFNEKEICELTEIQLFPPQKMVSIVQKGSPLRKMITYGLRRATEAGLMDYQRKVWHSPRPRCVKQIHADDLRVDLQTFASALLVLIFGYAVSLLALSIELIQHKLWQRHHTELVRK